MIYRLVIILGMLFSATVYAQTPLEADYVIVGTGTAGSYLAKTLSDDKTASVIALHNGKNFNQDEMIKVSRNALFTVIDSFVGSELFHYGETIPQIHANNRKMNWSVSKSLGGGSAVSAEIYVIGSKQFYSDWEAVAGSKWWSVDRIAEIYHNLEHYSGKTTAPFTRGRLGPLPVSQNPVPSAVSLKFTQAEMQATGKPFILDYNDLNAPAIGISSQAQSMVYGPNDAYRVISSEIFLNRAVMTPQGEGVDGRKLQVLFNSTGSKVIWQGNKAIGVEYIQNGQTKKVYAKKAVIITAGLHSSAFLMRSGIGSKKLLESLKIPVIYDNPNVGRGLSDQPNVVFIFSSNIDDTPFSIDDDLKIDVKNFHFNKNNFSQLFTTPEFKLTSQSKQYRDYADIFFTQIAYLPDPIGDPKKRAMLITTFNHIPGITMMGFHLARPKSQGSITIQSQDPFVLPIVDYGTFSNPEDLNLYVRSIQTYLPKIQKALEKIDPEYQLLYPSLETINNKALLTDYVKDEINTTIAYSGHCRMAPLNQGGVVDSTGHVYGVENLIVADSSVIPTPSDGGPLAISYLIAANIGQIILESNAHKA